MRSGHLAYFTLELRRPADGWATLAALTANARRASAELQREGVQVRFLRSVFVPEDEACFYLYQAATEAAVREAARRAAVEFSGIARQAAAKPR